MLVRFSSRSHSALFGAVGCLFCRAASADPSASCPDGWFCEPAPDAEAPRAAPGGAPYSVPETPDDSQADMRGAPDLVLPGEEAGYEPEAVRGDRVFGVQLRLNVPLIDDGDSPAHPFMAGPGLGFAFLPLQHIGLELAVDSAFGRDALDAERRELAVSGALLALFDTHELVQISLSTGLFHSWAHVRPPASYDRDYRYFGAFLGLGAELNFHPLMSAFLRLDAFMRGRVDEGASQDPEFIHRSSGETSNSSAGALLRVGVARYF